MDITPTEIWQTITSFCDPITQINMVSCCSLFYDRLYVTDLFNASQKKLLCLNDDILKQKKFINVVKLWASDNSNITNVAHMRNLRVLNAGGNCGIDKYGVKGLSLDKFFNNNHNFD